MRERFLTYFREQVDRALYRPMSIAPLVVFRICFGLLMFVSLARFWKRGWISAVYVQPSFHFTYTGFEWVRPLGDTGMHVLFAVILLAALLITVGLFYRAAAIVFFLGFTYVELIDATTYLNHYYFISLIAFLLIWLPANRWYALDVYWKWVAPKDLVPAWTVNILRFQMAVVYVFAGIAKLNADWLLEAQPMRMWLPGTTHIPVVGPYMYQEWVAYLFSWFGAAYDLFIAFFLLNRKTRPVAYLFVIIFHAATAIFFPGIGLFPYVMIVCGLIFFSPAFHQRILALLPFGRAEGQGNALYRFPRLPFFKWMLGAYVLLQLLIPFRYLLYPGHLFWTEEGYRFSWRVMLMEKSGAAYFTVKDEATHQRMEVTNAAYLTPLQEKMMSTQPDMIVRYARHLAGEFRKKGMERPEVYAEVYVSLNGQRSRLFIDSTVDLAAQRIGWYHNTWVLPYKR